jgi:PAS domain S-box-containing protein
MVITVSLSICALGLLTWMETQGRLGPANFGVGMTVWLTHVSTLVVVAIMVFYSRSTSQRALEQQHEELQRRIRSEQERDRSLERFTRIFRSSPSPMLAQSARTGVLLDVNPAFERCYGYPRDAVLGRTDGFLWAHPSERKAYLQRLSSQRSAYQVACEGRRADGSTFNALLSSEMGSESQDQLVISTIVDVSAQTEALERLRRSEERFAKAFNFSPMNLSITRLSDGMIMEVNRANAISRGLQTEPLRGRTTLQTGAWMTPAERQAFVDRLRRDGRVNGYESRMRGKDGNLVDVRLWAVIIDLDGEECILSSTVNVSEEKRREALLLSVARGMTGETGKAFFSALTRHAAQTLKADIVLIGELRADQRIHTLSVWVDGQPAPDFDYDPNGMPCQGTLAQHELFVQESGLMASFPDAQLLSTLQAEAYVGQCLFDQDGTPAGVLAALWRQPISVGAEARALMSIFASRAAAELIRMHREREIQRLNATLEQRVKLRTAELEKLNAELDSFAYSVSHDLKSPLRSIDGFTQLLAEQLQGRLSVDEEQLLDRVLKSTRRMSTLIADMLALARVSQGQLGLALTDLSEMAEQVMQAERGKHPGRTFEWRIEPGLMAVCDPRLVRIALDNLLGNAVKYTRDQPQTLIEMGRHDRTGPFPGMFFVRDNGVGFNMAYADKLFKPFQRLHGPSDFEGTGIGLATVRRIVERHGGRIEGCASPGAGAEFRFSFEPAVLQR